MSEVVLGRTGRDGLRAIAIGTAAEQWKRDCKPLGIDVIRADTGSVTLGAETNRSSFELWRGVDRRLTTDEFGSRTPSLVKEFQTDQGSQVTMVLVDGSDFIGLSLLERSVRLKTASWLSLLKPAGSLIIILDQGNNVHSVDCWSRHLACFPGRLTRLVPSSSWRHLLHQWLPTGKRVSRQAPTTTWAVQLQCPAESVSTADWNRHALRGLLTGRKDCCAVATPTLALPRAA